MILFRGECIEVPVYVEKNIYDFEICLLNHIYREKIVFFNRSNTSMKIQMEVPKETKRFFEFNPSLGYIQVVYNILKIFSFYTRETQNLKFGLNSQLSKI